MLEGRCVPYGEANVWWPVAEAVRHGFGIAQSEPVGTARDKTTGAVALVLGESTSPDEIDRITNGILHLLGYEGPLAGIDASRAREEVNRSLLTLLDGWADQRQPVVVVLSDLHWADDVVLEMIDTLLERAAGRPVVLIATARPTLFDRWQPQPGRHNTVVLNLDPLDREAADAAARRARRPRLPGGAARPCCSTGRAATRSSSRSWSRWSASRRPPGSAGGDRVEITGPTLTQLPDNLRGLVAGPARRAERRRAPGPGRRGRARPAGRRSTGCRIMAQESGAPDDRTAASTAWWPRSC